MKRNLPLLLLCVAGAAGGLAACSDNPVIHRTPNVTSIHDVDFLEGKFFFLTDPDSTPVPQSINEVRLFLDDHTAANDAELGARDADVWLDPDLRTPVDPVRGSFHLLREGSNDDYVLSDVPFVLPVIVLRNPLSPDYTLAVAYSYVQDGVLDTAGMIPGPADTIGAIQLKMVRPASSQWNAPDNDLTRSPWGSVRRLEFRNAYDLGVRDIDPAVFRLTVVRDVAGDGGDNPSTLEDRFGRITPLIEVLGLDQKNNLDPSDRVPDGKVDPEYVDFQNGILFFPDLRPFDPGPADIEGSDASGRPRSWPWIAGASRPDTLGWEVDPVTGEAVPSPPAVRDEETAPGIYDLLPAYLSTVATTHHRYTLEVVTDAEP